MKYVNHNGITYHLHKTTAKLRSGKMQDIYYFAKTINTAKSIAVVPAGFEVVENKRTGLPCLRKLK